MTWDQFHRIQGTCKGGQSHGIFFLSLILMLEIYVQFCGQRFLETGDLGPMPSNAGDLWGWPITKDFLSIVNFQAGHLCSILWSTFSRNLRGFRTWEQFHRMQGTCRGGQSHRILFLSLIFMLGICVHFCGQRFLEAGEVSGPGTTSIESRGPVRVTNHIGFSSYR